jgi:uncharacterized membrane protein YfcA
VIHFSIALLAGLLVGTINGMAGGASLISYPIMLALGLHPVNAAVTNALGISSANFFAIRSGPHSFRKLFITYRTLILLSLTFAIAGAFLLLSMPAKTFEKIVPFLLLGATLMMLVPKKPRHQHRNKRTEQIGIAASGFYCGYFGPGQGVMVVATLARNRDEDAPTLNAAKNMIVGVTSLASNFIYIFSGRVYWSLALALFIGSSFGGTLGGKWASRMSPTFYKALVVIVGLSASLWLFIRYFG